MLRNVATASLDIGLKPAGQKVLNLNVDDYCQKNNNNTNKKDNWRETRLIYFPGKASLHYIILSFLLLGWETPVRKWQMVGNNKRKEMSSFKKEILRFSIPGCKRCGECYCIM